MTPHARAADPPPDRASQTEDFRTRLPKLWKRQRELMTAGRFLVRVARLQPQMSREEFDRLFGTLDLTDVPGFLERLYKQFPIPFHHLPLTPVEVRADAGRRLEIWHRNAADGSGLDRVSFKGAGVYVDYQPANRTVVVSRARVAVLGIPDLCYLPAVAADELSAEWQVASRRDGRLTLRRTAVLAPRGVQAASPPAAAPESASLERTVDERTGFVFEDRVSFSADGHQPRVVRQLGPVADAQGRVRPTVRADATFDRDRVPFLSVYHIAEADLGAALADADFAVAVPAGTQVVDARDGRDNFKRQLARDPVPDVLAYVGTVPDDARSIWPVLKPGTPAPNLDGVTWLTKDSPAAAPVLKGKVVLIDFWGIGCGPCVAQLPAVQAAAQKYAGTDLVIVGLHDAHGKPDDVAAFARTHGLTYQLAIDRAEEKHFGATFRAYGIRGIPNAAVLDRAGRIAFVGPFKDALTKAQELLAATK
jgi:thiol-disulfide isomerase/thioredoxin